MRFYPGDFVRSINPRTLFLEVVMVYSESVSGGCLCYAVTNGEDSWTTFMLRPMPNEVTAKRKRGKRKPKTY